MLDTFPWERFVFSSNVKEPIKPLYLIMVLWIGSDESINLWGWFRTFTPPLVITQDRLSSPLLLYLRGYDTRACSLKQWNISFCLVVKPIEKRHGNCLSCALTHCLWQRTLSHKRRRPFMAVPGKVLMKLDSKYPCRG